MTNNQKQNFKKINLNKNINVELVTLDAKHKEMNLRFNQIKENILEIDNEIRHIQIELDKINNIKITCNNQFDTNLIHQKAYLLDRKALLEMTYENILSNHDEMDYYDDVGDLIIEYYDTRDNKNNINTETKNILEFLNEKKKNIKINILEKYYKRLLGVKINRDNISTDRLKYCLDCNIEKILNLSESSYICPWCGDTEIIILDEDKQIKDYSPYKRLNHFREWINQFQAKQTPEIPEQVFIDIIAELSKNRIKDLSLLNKKNMKSILKKLGYNIYYEHIIYIINKINNLPPPKITRDMEKVFIIMFYKIQEPWLLYKKPNRKNFLSYSYVLYKFCELLELDHLLECFFLHKDPSKIIENDQIWEKICNHLNWEFISSFK